MVHARLAAMVCVAFVFAALSAYAQDADPRIGVWRMNVAKSTLAGAAPKSLVRTFEDYGDGLVFAWNDTVDAEGNRTKGGFVMRCDGREYPTGGANATMNTVSCKRAGANAVEIMFKADGKVGASGTEMISNGGKTYTFTAKGTNAQGQTIIQVFDRQ